MYWFLVQNKRKRHNPFFIFLKRLVFLLTLCGMAGCGRKQKNIFNFKKKSHKPQCSLFDLPSVRGVTALRDQEGIYLSWLVRVEEHNNLPAAIFNGYDVYRLLSSRGIISKQPINKTPIMKTWYRDHSKQDSSKSFGYLIRPRFLCGQQIIHGLASQIVWV